ncbi:MAG TPA: hypothetical protein PLU37_04145, partial [Chitinophagaceae bacterium]|nr:hypothetical protein [Chitinophagaceae bacterium]
MGIRVSLLIVILFISYSCSNNEEGSISRNELSTSDSILKNEPHTGQKENQVITDTIHKWIADDYPITNEMFSNHNNNPFLKKISGKTISVDKGWFTNGKIHQTIVIELATDYHRMQTFHFDNNVIIEDLINQIALFDSNMELASDNQIQKDLSGFIKQAKKIDSSFFSTN